VAVDVFRFEMAGPGDSRHLAEILRHIPNKDTKRIAVIAKTEGTATINDFGRSVALRAFQDAFKDAGITVAPQIILSMGSEGIISPGGYLFVDGQGDRSGLPGLAFGLASSVPLTPAEIMSERHIDVARSTTQQAIKDAGLDPDNVALVLAKSPLLSREKAAHLPSRQRELANLSWASRGIAALGIGVALKEIEPAQVGLDALGRRTDLFSRRAMVFSGTETDRVEVIVLGNRPGAPTAIRSGQIADIIDLAGLARVVSDDGSIETALAMSNNGRIVASFFKAGISTDGRVRGQRTTVFSSELDPDKHMRAAGSGVLGALLGDTRFFVSGGAEHQAAPGGGLFAIIQKQ
jgi:cyanuric acid amidohydrolase